jgi:hypothetical protein
MAKPTEYHLGVGNEVCARLQNGEYLDVICSDADMPSRATVALWRRSVPAFAQMYREAEELLADLLFDQAQRVADETAQDFIEIDGPGGKVITRIDHEAINRSRLRVDTLMKRAMKLNPLKYGDRPDTKKTDDGVLKVYGGLPSDADNPENIDA